MSAGKTAFNKGLTIEESLEFAGSAAAATQAVLRDIQAAVANVKHRLESWVNEELFIAAEKGKADEVAECLRKGANSNWLNPEKRDMTALIAACQANKIGTVKVLAGWHQTDVNLIAGNTTAIHMAAKHTDAKCLKALLEAGVWRCDE